MEQSSLTHAEPNDATPFLPFRLTRHRGELLDGDLARIVAATVHPSSILRGPDEEREEARAALADDLKVVAAAL